MIGAYMSHRRMDNCAAIPYVNFKSLTWTDISVSVPVLIFWEFCHFVGTFLRLVTNFLKTK